MSSRRRSRQLGELVELYDPHLFKKRKSRANNNVSEAEVVPIPSDSDAEVMQESPLVDEISVSGPNADAHTTSSTSENAPAVEGNASEQALAMQETRVQEFLRRSKQLLKDMDASVPSVSNEVSPTYMHDVNPSDASGTSESKVDGNVRVSERLRKKRLVSVEPERPRQPSKYLSYPVNGVYVHPTYHQYMPSSVHPTVSPALSPSHYRVPVISKTINTSRNRAPPVSPIKQVVTNAIPSTARSPPKCSAAQDIYISAPKQLSKPASEQWDLFEDNLLNTAQSQRLSTTDEALSHPKKIKNFPTPLETGITNSRPKRSRSVPASRESSAVLAPNAATIYAPSQTYSVSQLHSYLPPRQTTQRKGAKKTNRTSRKATASAAVPAIFPAMPPYVPVPAYPMYPLATYPVPAYPPIYPTVLPNQPSSLSASPIITHSYSSASFYKTLPPIPNLPVAQSSATATTRDDQPKDLSSKDELPLLETPPPKQRPQAQQQPKSSQATQAPSLPRECPICLHTMGGVCGVTPPEIRSPCCNQDVCLRCAHQALVRRGIRPTCLMCQNPLQEEYVEEVFAEHKRFDGLKKKTKRLAVESLDSIGAKWKIKSTV